MAASCSTFRVSARSTSTRAARSCVHSLAFGRPSCASDSSRRVSHSRSLTARTCRSAATSWAAAWGGTANRGGAWRAFACARSTSSRPRASASRSIERSHPDLYWAARGAGPAFCAVATRFHLEAFPYPRRHARRRLHVPDREQRERCALAARARAQAHSRPRAHDGARDGVGREAVHGRDRVLRGDGGRGSRDTADRGALRTTGPRSVRPTAAGPITFDDLYAASLTQHPLRVAADNIWTTRPLEAAEQFAAAWQRAPSPKTVGIVNFQGDRGALPDAACSSTGTAYVLWMAAWSDPAQDDENFRWAQAMADELQPYTSACYVNECDLERRPERAQPVFSCSRSARGCAQSRRVTTLAVYFRRRSSCCRRVALILRSCCRSASDARSRVCAARLVRNGRIAVGRLRPLAAERLAGARPRQGRHAVLAAAPDHDAERRRARSRLDAIARARSRGAARLTSRAASNPYRSWSRDGSCSARRSTASWRSILPPEPSAGSSTRRSTRTSDPRRSSSVAAWRSGSTRQRHADAACSTRLVFATTRLAPVCDRCAQRASLRRFRQERRSRAATGPAARVQG